jgi:hypothetical protein
MKQQYLKKALPVIILFTVTMFYFSNRKYTGQRPSPVAGNQN